MAASCARAVNGFGLLAGILILLAVGGCALLQPAPGTAPYAPYTGSGSAHENGGGEGGGGMM
jgi:hypothetical protein